MTDQIENAEEKNETPVDPRLLTSLICPVSRQKLVYDAVNNELVSKTARLAYPIRGGIPLMLLEEARDMDLTPQPMPDLPAGEGDEDV